MSTRAPTRDDITFSVQKYWGYDSFRPLQREAIEAGLDGRDSLVVLPTGGGKSLCYQVPPVVASRTDIVVSPLIYLMKDQVDALRASGYPAAALHSGMSDDARREVTRRFVAGEYRLLFVAPERLLAPSFLALVDRVGVSAFAIDEAHCISHWGHDFRPEYRQLAMLKRRWPNASVHAFTATATPRVREDIARQLGLKDPLVLVGVFDRPNLTYRIEPRTDVTRQVLEALRRHPGEATIVYCISRNDAERLAKDLGLNGIKAASYHAGLDTATRTRTQDAFSREEIDVVVATVAFGMGIDRSNVRCVIHAAMPKSIEHYQQETGRAGRDGLEAECLLLYSPADSRRWEYVVRRSAEEAGQPEQLLAGQVALLRETDRFCSTSQCRHRALAEYFGQRYESDSCGACDVCLSERGTMAGSGEIARKVLGCVQGLGWPFGVAYIVDVLRGSTGAKIVERRHNALPEHGALRSMTKEAVRDVVQQMIELGLLSRTTGEMPVVRMTPLGARVLAGEQQVELRSPAAAIAGPPATDLGWTGVDRGLFERLRVVRREIADGRNVAAFVVFSDATLRDFARQRPSTPEAFLRVRGVGERKAADLGERFVAEIASYCRENGVETDVRVAAPATPTRSVQRAPRAPSQSQSRAQAFDLFDKGRSVEDVAEATGRVRSTVAGYLDEYIAERKPVSVRPWVNAKTYAVVLSAAKRVGGPLMRPVFDALGGSVPFDDIRVVMRHAGLR